MGARNVMIQYVGDILYLPKFERPVKRIIEQRHDISPFDRQEFRPVKTCKRVNIEGETYLFSCSVCGNFLIDDDNFCSYCGAKVVKNEQA